MKKIIKIFKIYLIYKVNNYFFMKDFIILTNFKLDKIRFINYNFKYQSNFNQYYLNLHLYFIIIYLIEVNIKYKDY